VKGKEADSGIERPNSCSNCAKDGEKPVEKKAGCEGREEPNSSLKETLE